MSFVKLSGVILSSLSSFAFFVGTVHAENHALNPTLNEKWHFELGGFRQSADIKISAGPVGEELDLVDLNRLGADNNDDAIWLGARWRINERWNVGLSYLEVDRVGVATSTEEFKFGEPPDEVNVSIDASITSEFNTKYYILQGGYTLLKTDRANLGVGAGLHIMELEASISAKLTSDGVTTDFGTGASDALAPLPNIYFFGDYAITPRLAVTGSISWLGLEVDEYDGELTSVVTNLEYRPRKNFGIGIGYTLVNVDVTINDGADVAKFE
ncbi:MAG: hypothetical protein KAG66_22645, partial [Methylococcales bacterium]|nr:hypothetical protein [Methylococcales bacterium]